jgi:hypothetical protein
MKTLLVTLRLYLAVFSLTILVGVLAPLAAQTFRTSRPPDNTAQFAHGVRLAPVPAALYAHLPSLQPGQGVFVEDIEAHSALAEAGLARFDILLALDGTRLRDGMHFNDMIAKAREGQKSTLELMRAGKVITLSFAHAAAEAVSVPKGLLKAGGPPAVAVEAQPLEAGKLKVIFVFYSPAGKLERVTCSGSMVQIEAEVRQLGEEKRMPPRVQDLVDVALKRIRVLNSAEKP